MKYSKPIEKAMVSNDWLAKYSQKLLIIVDTHGYVDTSYNNDKEITEMIRQFFTNKWMSSDSLFRLPCRV